METILPGLAILGALLVVMDSGRGSHWTRAARKAQKQLLARMIRRLRLVADATDTCWHGTVGERALVMRRAPVGVLLRASFTVPLFHTRLRVKVHEEDGRAFESRLEVKTSQNLATSALLSDPNLRRTLDSLSELGNVIVSRDHLDVHLDRDHADLHDRIVNAVAAIERHGRLLDVPHVDARRLGFLPRASRLPRRAHFAGHGWLGDGELSLSADAIVWSGVPEDVEIRLDEPVRALLSRSTDRHDAPRVHLELRQRAGDGVEWRSVVLSCKAATFDAPVDQLPELDQRGVWLAPAEFRTVLARVRAHLLTFDGEESWS